MIQINRLRHFVTQVTAALSPPGEPSQPPANLKSELKKLVSHDDWLPESFALPNQSSYRQYLLYCDPFERMSIVSFVWARGQQTPIHNHTVWGAVGQLRGSETSIPYARGQDKVLRAQSPETSHPKDVFTFGPEDEGDIHKVFNDSSDVAISIHVYGGNIGKIERSTFDENTFEANSFISDYSNDVLPNIWV
ncbi:cysteine dioxygenase [Marinomonas algicola]|uniref:cysteine dioxygenase family protein n=1 Tax=Marinomonas algicola TaxID=2773454 RepID=UPI001749FEAA|nr:cysteine dioxygenase [Marinomonas algicola]